MLLLTLRRISPVTVGELADYLECKPSNLSVVCKLAEKKKIVHRKRGQDERKVYISLSKDGEEKAKILEEILSVKYEKFLSLCSPEEFAVITKGFDTFSKIAKKYNTTKQ